MIVADPVALLRNSAAAGALTRAVRAALDADPRLIDPRRYLAPAREAIQAEAARILTHLAE